MNHLHIRDARDGDQDQIREVTLSAYQEYAAVMPPPAWLGYRQNILATLADVRPAEQIVAEVDGAIIGTVLLFPDGTTVHAPDGSAFTLEYPEIRLLAVAPAARGQGAGKKLVVECIRRAREQKTVVLTLHTSDMMQTAMQMYERIGFVRMPKLDFNPAPGILVKGYQLDLASHP
ncbi:MAG: GNAT family N-acetyltransferase [Chloroflexi bacterium]|nr:GNAT family N-acetyltransferase [Chloroflexota bacterium]